MAIGIYGHILCMKFQNASIANQFSPNTESVSMVVSFLFFTAEGRSVVHCSWIRPEALPNPFLNVVAHTSRIQFGAINIEEFVSSLPRLGAWENLGLLLVFAPQASFLFFLNLAIAISNDPALCFFYYFS